MSDFTSPEEAYKTLAEALNYLSKKGETILLHPHRERAPASISGFSGGVLWSLTKQQWVNYNEG